MTAPRYDRPAADEYAPYYERYVAKVGSGDLLSLLASQTTAVNALLQTVTDERAATAYAPDKWTIKEVVGHLIDAERVFSYRALTFARLDQNPLPAFDENAWVPPARFNERLFVTLVDEWLLVRNATIALLAGLPDDAPTRRGTASGHEVSVRALAYIIYGHLAHHLEILKTRYLSPAK
ncbi:MAG: DinB family protein [Gemmatimonadales bacterium]|nr:DinB family protein [Gemmatimonadales bacterium]